MMGGAGVLSIQASFRHSDCEPYYGNHQGPLKTPVLQPYPSSSFCLYLNGFIQNHPLCLYSKLVLLQGTSFRKPSLEPGGLIISTVPPYDHTNLNSWGQKLCLFTCESQLLADYRHVIGFWSVCTVNTCVQPSWKNIMFWEKAFSPSFERKNNSLFGTEVPRLGQRFPLPPHSS